MQGVCISRKRETAYPRGEYIRAKQTRIEEIQKEGEQESLKEVEAVGIKGSLNRASSVSHSHLVVQRILFLEINAFPKRLPLWQDVRNIYFFALVQKATKGEFRGLQKNNKKKLFGFIILFFSL